MSIQDLHFSDYISRPTTTAIDYSSWIPLIGQIMAMQDQNTANAVDSPPEQQKVNMPFLRNTANTSDLLNRLQSMNFDQQQDPAGYQARQQLNQRILSDASSGPSTDLSNLWTKMGLEQGIATGANQGSGFARSALADATRSDYIAERQRVNNELAGLSAANPMLQTGLDTGAVLNRLQNSWDTNQQNRMQYQQTNMGNANQNVANMMGLVQSMMQTSAAQKQSDIQAQRDYQNSKLSWDLYMQGLQSANPSMNWWQRAMNGARIGAQEGSIGGPWGMIGGAAGGAVDGAANGPIYRWQTGGANASNGGMQNYQDYGWLGSLGSNAASLYRNYYSNSMANSSNMPNAATMTQGANGQWTGPYTPQYHYTSPQGWGY